MRRALLLAPRALHSQHALPCALVNAPAACMRAASTSAVAAPGGASSATTAAPPLFFTTAKAEVPRDQFEVEEELGLVTACHVRTVNILADIWAAVTGILGGETRSYSKLLDETTQEALTELRLAAEARGANGVVNVRLSTTTTMNRMIVGLHATVVVYGTAVRVRPLQ